MAPLPPPSDAFALSILEKVERLLATGRFTTTYKFALLVALTNIAVERGDDSGDALDVDLDEIARQYLLLYWNQARPHPRVGAVLRQWTDARKPSQIVAMLRDAATESPLGHQRLRTHRGRDSLVSRTRQTLAKDVLYRLQTFATGAGRDRAGDSFLYDHPPTAAAGPRRTPRRPPDRQGRRRMDLPPRRAGVRGAVPQRGCGTHSRSRPRAPIVLVLVPPLFSYSYSYPLVLVLVLAPEPLVLTRPFQTTRGGRDARGPRKGG
jgi:hypothetical protein